MHCGDFRDLEARINVAAVSPDGLVRARVTGGEQVSVGFSRDAYDDYREPGSPINCDNWAP
jgi:hypothetical protein